MKNSFLFKTYNKKDYIEGKWYQELFSSQNFTFVVSLDNKESSYNDFICQIDGKVVPMQFVGNSKVDYSKLFKIDSVLTLRSLKLDEILN